MKRPDLDAIPDEATREIVRGLLERIKELEAAVNERVDFECDDPRPDIPF